MDNDIFGEESQSTDEFEMPSTSKKVKTKKSNRPSRKIGLTWSEQDESRLILAVQKQRPLWDCSVPEYKLAHVKLDCWEVVAEELDMVGNFSEARTKWNSMRSNFKVFLGKHRNKKSGQGADEGKNLKYPHFNELLFIESAEIEQSTKSTSTLDKDNGETDGTVSDNLSKSMNEEDFEISPIIIQPTVGQRKKRSASRTSVQTPSPTLSSLGVKKMAAEVLANFQNRAQADRFTAIGEVFAGHLRNLAPKDAINLESCLFKVLYDFLGSHTSSDATSTVTILDQNGLEITDPQILNTIAVVPPPTNFSNFSQSVTEDDSICVEDMTDTQPPTTSSRSQPKPTRSKRHLDDIEREILSELKKGKHSDEPCSSHSRSDQEILLLSFVPYIRDMNETELMDFQMEVIRTVKEIKGQRPSVQPQLVAMPLVSPALTTSDSYNSFEYQSSPSTPSNQVEQHSALEGRSTIKSQIKAGLAGGPSAVKRQTVLTPKAQVVTIPKPVIKFTTTAKTVSVDTKGMSGSNDTTSEIKMEVDSDTNAVGSITTTSNSAGAGGASVGVSAGVKRERDDDDFEVVP